MGDDDIIRRKLLIDGDGLGDDRRIVTLMRTFIKWCSSDDDESEMMLTYERMIAMLAHCESIMVKSRLTSAMYQAEMQNYEELYQQIEQSIANAHVKIQNCKAELLRAKRIRKNRQEYDVLAKVIHSHPDRQETMRKLEKLDNELANLKKTKSALEDKLNSRRKHFSVLRNAIHELQLLLEADEADGTEEHDMKEDPMDIN